MRRDFIPNLQDVHVHTRGYLPHWEMPDAIYFITYRLHDSLPKHVVQALKEEHRALKRMHNNGASVLDRARIRLAFGESLDRALDRGYGAAHLMDPRIACVVRDNLRYFDGVRYETIAWCVMPTHVHVVIRVLGAQKLAKIVQSWKSYTGKRGQQDSGAQRSVLVAGVLRSDRAESGGFEEDGGVCTQQSAEGGTRELAVGWGRRRNGRPAAGGPRS